MTQTSWSTDITGRSSSSVALKALECCSETKWRNDVCWLACSAVNRIARVIASSVMKWISGSVIPGRIVFFSMSREEVQQDRSSLSASRL